MLQMYDTINLFCTETPKIAFAASLGGNGVQKTTSGNKDLIYRDVLTNVGGAYNAETGQAPYTVAPDCLDLSSVTVAAA